MADATSETSRDGRDARTLRRRASDAWRYRRPVVVTGGISVACLLVGAAGLLFLAATT